MEQKGIHYRTGGKLTHAGCEMLPDGKDIPYIVIERIDYLAETKVNGRTETNVWVATFAPNQYTKLPMLLNSTNRKRIAKLFPDCNGYINLLKNIPVRLTRELTRDVQDGGDTWGLRISKTPASKPATPNKPVLTKENEKIWSQAVQYLKAGHSIDKIKKNYDLSEEAEKQLMEEVQNG